MANFRLRREVTGGSTGKGSHGGPSWLQGTWAFECSVDAVAMLVRNQNGIPALGWLPVRGEGYFLPKSKHEIQGSVLCLCFSHVLFLILASTMNI